MTWVEAIAVLNTVVFGICKPFFLSEPFRWPRSLSALSRQISSLTGPVRSLAGDIPFYNVPFNCWQMRFIDKWDIVSSINCTFFRPTGMCVFKPSNLAHISPRCWLNLILGAFSFAVSFEFSSGLSSSSSWLFQLHWASCKGDKMRWKSFSLCRVRPTGQK